MTIRKFIISLVLVAIIALSFIACSGTKSICPAYSSVEAEMSVNPNG
jgi:hypothetical protein